jgi:phage FluMu protein Com
MEFKQIASFDNYLLANMTLGLLQENDINCHLKDEYIVTTDPLEEMETAKALIKDAETEYLGQLTCPRCKQKGIEAEETIKAPADFWGKLKNQVLFGQTSTYKKIYRCKNCKKVFDELPGYEEE